MRRLRQRGPRTRSQLAVVATDHQIVSRVTCVTESLQRLEELRYERAQATVDEAYEAARASGYDPGSAEMRRLREAEATLEALPNPYLATRKVEDSDGRV